MIKIIKIQENEDNITAYFTIDYKGKIYEWHGGCPKDVDPQSHFEGREDMLRFYLLKRIYSNGDILPDWQRFKTDEKTELEAMEAWIVAGHKNKIPAGLTAAGKPKYGYKIIEKKEWKSSHPKWIRLTAKIEGANITPEMKDLLKEIVK